MSGATTTPTLAGVRSAVASVDDPEYPGVGITELGLVTDVRLRGRRAEVDLVPTFSGCPALAMIAADVRAAVMAVDGIDEVDVTWVAHVAWSPGRVSPTGRRALADGFTVTVRRSDGSLLCPVCGSTAVTDTSDAGPARCRSLAWCPQCRNPVEVLR